MNHAAVEQIITDFIRTSPENDLNMKTEEPAWKEFLLGFSAGDDPIFEQYKEVVAKTHFTPAEIYNLTYPDEPADPSELTVISWALIQRGAVKKDNAQETLYPSERWAKARHYGEIFNEALRNHVVSELSRNHINALAPVLSPHWKLKQSETDFLFSTWSERHAAYASGLGTFGLCDGLITEKGKAHRVGSVVARIKLDPTPRPYTDHHEYCLFFTSGKCLACAERCPVDAISKDGHDKETCFNHAFVECSKYVKNTWGFEKYACGLCQTKVPCANGIPKAMRK